MTTPPMLAYAPSWHRLQRLRHPKTLGYPSPGGYPRATCHPGAPQLQPHWPPPAPHLQHAAPPPHPGALVSPRPPVAAVAGGMYQKAPPPPMLAHHQHHQPPLPSGGPQPPPPPPEEAQLHVPAGWHMGGRPPANMGSYPSPTYGATASDGPHTLAPFSSLSAAPKILLALRIGRYGARRCLWALFHCPSTRSLGLRTAAIAAFLISYPPPCNGFLDGTAQRTTQSTAQRVLTNGHACRATE